MTLQLKTHPFQAAIFDWIIHFYRQLDFPSEPGVADEILENEPKNCLTLFTLGSTRTYLGTGQYLLA